MDFATVSKAPQSIDGVTSLRALVMQAYWALRRVRTPDLIGTPDIRFWIRANAPRAERPSDSLIRATLLAARLPRRAGAVRVAAPPPRTGPVGSHAPQARTHHRDPPGLHTDRGGDGAQSSLQPSGACSDRGD